VDKNNRELLVLLITGCSCHPFYENILNRAGGGYSEAIECQISANKIINTWLVRMWD
jgi:hypothetical protein